MNEVRRIIKNSGAAFLSQISTPAASFVLVYFIARSLGPAGLGKYSSVLSLLVIFQAVASLGFGNLITREVSQDLSNAKKYLINASLCGASFSIIITGLMCLAGQMITDDTDTILATYLLSIALLPQSLTLVSQAICRAHERLEYVAIPLIIGNTLKMAAGILILFKGYGFLELMVAILCGYFLITLLSIYFAVKCLRPPIRLLNQIDLRFCKSIITTSPNFALISIFGTIRLNIDIIILTKLMGEIDVGIYSAANKLVNLSKLAIICYIFALQPVIFRLFKRSMEKFRLICIDSLRYLLLIILPVIAGVIILSDKAILIIFSEAFFPSADVLKILIWILLLTGFNQIFANALIASHNQKINLQATFFGMICNISLNLLLIPFFGYIGAAIASVGSAFFNFAYQHIFLSRKLFKIKYFNLAIKPMIATAVMGMYVFFTKEFQLPFIICTSIIIYIISLLSLKAFTKNDIYLVRKLIRGEGKLA